MSELDGWRVCPRCGSELERDDGRVHCDACGFVFYASVRVVDGTPKPSDDVSELRWFAPGDVPIDELAFEHIEQVISTWRNEHA